MNRRYRQSFLSVLLLCSFALAGCDEVSPVGAGTGGFGAGTGTTTVVKDRWDTALETLVESSSLDSRLTGAGAAPVRQLYKQTGFKSVWHNKGRFKPEAQQALAMMATAADDGLNNSYFLPPEWRQGVRVANTNDPSAAAATEALLSSAFLAYARDISTGRHNPKPQPMPTSEMASAAQSGAFYGWMVTLAPNGISYRQLKNALIAQGPNLSEGQRNKIKLNMERLRWLDEPSSGQFVRVNIPGQELEAFNGDTAEMKMNVVVGRPSRATPIMKDYIYSLKYSPDWTVSRTVITEDFIPRLQKDRSYLKRNGYEVFSKGKRVDSTSITPSKLLNYTVRRPPGGQNPLGGVRFSLTNGQAIYLHDSPGSSQYVKKSRALSSGCVRVQDAAGLATWIHKVQGQSVSKSEVAARMNLKQSRTTQLSRRVPVSLAYMTVWVDGEGKLRFAPDIYSKDGSLAAQMNLTL